MCIRDRRMDELLEQFDEVGEASERIMREILLSLSDSWRQYKQDHFDTIDFSQADTFVGAFFEDPITQRSITELQNALQAGRGAEGLAR